MDYEKKYKEALEKARQLCAYPTSKPFISDLQDIFPELKESEDVKIRKEIKQFIRSRGMSLAQSKVDSWIAWLEKKCEQKPADKIEPKFKAGDRVIGIVSGMQYYITEVCDDHYYTESGCTIMFYAQDNFELYKQKPWSEEDRENSKNILYILNQLKGNAIYSEDKIAEKCIDWLKSLKDRVLPHPKQEWSDEDKKLIDDTCHLINTLASGYGEKVTEPITFSGTQMIASIKDRLRALIDNRPQNHWKPSDEHYELEEFAKIVRGNLTGISKAVQKLFEAKYLQLTGNKMYRGFKD